MPKKYLLFFYYFSPYVCNCRRKAWEKMPFSLRQKPFSTKISRECYIVIAPNVANQAFTMTYPRTWNSHKNHYDIAPEIIFDDNDDVIPPTV